MRSIALALLATSTVACVAPTSEPHDSPSTQNPETVDADVWGRIRTDHTHVWVSRGNGIDRVAVQPNLQVAVHFVKPFLDPDYAVQVTGSNLLDGTSLQYYYDPDTMTESMVSIVISDDSGNVFPPLAMDFDFSLSIKGAQ